MRTEQHLHREVVRYLGAALDHRSWFCHPANGGYRTPAEAGIFRALGVVAGTPDILVIHAGRAHWIELKAPPKTLKSGKKSTAAPAVSDAQIAVAAALVRAGCPHVAICRSIDEVQAALIGWGVPTRARVAA